MADALNLALTGGRPRAKGEGSAAFVEFVRRHEGELRRYLYSRVGNAEDAADLAQECFLRLLRYVDAHGGEDLERLMFRIANNLLTDNWRTGRAHHLQEHVPLTSVDLVNDSPSQERQVAAQQRLERLKGVIRQLPSKCRAVFVFSRIDGLSHAEIAGKFGISIKAVEKHITKALAACRAEVGDDDV
jgi:RNA polymerase sigma-70 factor (ECF subfamily)